MNVLCNPKIEEKEEWNIVIKIAKICFITIFTIMMISIVCKVLGI